MSQTEAGTRHRRAECAAAAGRGLGELPARLVVSTVPNAPGDKMPSFVNRPPAAVPPRFMVEPESNMPAEALALLANGLLSIELVPPPRSIEPMM